MQSPSTVHVVLHAPVPHRYGRQLDVGVTPHVPVPVQCETGVNVEPVHDAVPQLTLLDACSQAPPPLQLPVFPQGGFGAQRVCGSAVPEGTLLQVPAFGAMLQAWQSAHDEVLQQTPSTQKSPVRHSAVLAQDCPRRFLLPHRFVLRSQMLGARQSLSLVQAALHAWAPLHL
jgi:hypothetical protein